MTEIDREAAIKNLRFLSQECANLRRVLGFNDPGTVVWRSGSEELGCTDEFVVKADGSGGGMAYWCEGPYNGDRTVCRQSKSFEFLQDAVDTVQEWSGVEDEEEDESDDDDEEDLQVYYCSRCEWETNDEDDLNMDGYCGMCVDDIQAEAEADAELVDDDDTDCFTCGAEGRVLDGDQNCPVCAEQKAHSAGDLQLP